MWNDELSGPDDLAAAQQLLRQACNGDAAAAQQVLARYRSLVTQVIRETSAAPGLPPVELAQVEAYVQAHLAGFEGRIDQFGLWLRERCVEYCEQHAATAEQQAEVGWIQQAMAGDKAAFAALYERHSSAVYTHVYYRLSNDADAQEAVQEIFLRAYMRLHTFDVQRRFRTWLLAIASNYCTDQIRRRTSLKRLFKPVPLEDVDFWLADNAANPERSALRRERHDQVHAALQQLPSQYREVLILFYWNDLSYQEIVEVTGLKENNVKTLLRRARLKLADLLEAQAARHEQAATSP
jgi:RNA polymerase sigma-70 factor (ECF subfamily)